MPFNVDTVNLGGVVLSRLFYDTEELSYHINYEDQVEFDQEGRITQDPIFFHKKLPRPLVKLFCKRIGRSILHEQKVSD